ncbi:MAG: T9SS type A sorting domain-containing protein [Saprospiraceae bacterium]|nr:T9SS type A sorting domain-containing protein [Saprospiraceae bacterium]
MKSILISLILVSFLHTASGSTFTVINTNPDGAGSLIEAIDLANANPGMDSIVFDIPGIAPHVIPLSIVTGIEITSELFLDGSTQPGNGYTGTCPKIVLDASGVDQSIPYLIAIATPDVKVYGVWIRNFINPGSTALYINGPYTYVGSPDRKNIFTNVVNAIKINKSNVWIYANYFGCDCDGISLMPNEGDAIFSFEPLFNVNIAENLMSGNANGIQLGTTNAATENVTITGNKIGTDITGTVSLGNRENGITLFNIINLQLGGTGGFNGNVVSGNAKEGCHLTACAGTVYGNKIGTDITGHDTLPNDPVHTDYNTALNCNGYPGFSSNLTIGGTDPDQQNIIFGNDIALNVADYSGHYEIINNLIGQTLSGIVSPLQFYGFQMYYDTTYVHLENNFIYGVNAAAYAIQGKNLQANGNVMGHDIHGNALSLTNGYSISMTDSLLLQNNTIRNCVQGIFMNGCNDAYIGLNSIEHCQTPIVMRAAELFDCHHNQLFRNAIFSNDYTVNLFTGSPLAANDNISPPVFQGSTIDSTWGTALPLATVDLSYDITLTPGEPQGFSYPVSPITADANGHWVYAGYLERPDELTAMQTDEQNNSSGFATPLIVGVVDAFANSIQIYPNPTSDFLIVEDKEGIAWENWSILNTAGILMEKGNIAAGKSDRINVQHLIPGQYFLKVSSATQSAISKWVKL